jgi:uncharacterized protein (TIGR03067 family)
MSFLMNFYPGDNFIFLTINVLLQVSTVILVAWLLARFAFRNNAAVRHNVWLFALSLVFISPITAYIADAAGLRILTISMPMESQPDYVTSGSMAVSTNSSDIDDQQPVDFQRQAATTIAEHRPNAANSISRDTASLVTEAQGVSAADRLRAIAVPAIAVWVLGMFYLFVRLFLRGYVLRRLLETARSVDNDVNLRPIFAEIRGLLDINRLPAVLLWPDSQVSVTPLTAGIFRPIILLSEKLLDSLNHEELRDVLVHECAHVLRRDPLIGLLQRIVGIMFWPYPLVWLMNRNLARAREEVCDNYVLMHTDGLRYAQTLFDLSRQIHSISPSLAQVGLFQYYWPLEQRVAGLLDQRRNVMTKINRFTLGVLVVTFSVAGILVAGTRLLTAQPLAESAASADSSSKVERRAVNKPAETSIQGPWRTENGVIKTLLSVEQQPLSMVISEKTLTMRVGEQKFSEMDYTLDSKQTPAAIDVKYHGQDMPGILELAGDKLKISFNDVKKGRPTDFGDKNNDMDLVLYRYKGLPLMIINADGTNPRPLTSLPEYTCAASHWSPDGSKISFDCWHSFVGDDWPKSHIFVVNSDGTSPKDLGDGCLSSWSPDGKRIAYYRYPPNNGIWVMNADGTDNRLIDAQGRSADWSPKSDEVAYTIGSNIRVYDLKTNTRRNLLNKKYGLIRWGLAFSPDGRWICFHGTLPDSSFELALVDAQDDAKGFIVLLPRNDVPNVTAFQTYFSWSPEGRRIALSMSMKSDSNMQIYILDVEGKKPPQRLAEQDPKKRNWTPAWSPDGKVIAYAMQN